MLKFLDGHQTQLIFFFGTADTREIVVSNQLWRKNVASCGVEIIPFCSIGCCAKQRLTRTIQVVFLSVAGYSIASAEKDTASSNHIVLLDWQPYLPMTPASELPSNLVHAEESNVCVGYGHMLCVPETSNLESTEWYMSSSLHTRQGQTCQRES